jgi:hypothetical protein
MSGYLFGKETYRCQRDFLSETFGKPALLLNDAMLEGK